MEVSYAYAGDMQGTGEKAISKDRIVSHETTTSKLFGKTTNTDSWTMFTPEWNYTADLTKKTGLKLPNVLPYMEKAYDDLDGTSKKRLHQNMQDMAQMIVQGVRQPDALERREDRRDQDLRRRDVRGAHLRGLHRLLDEGCAGRPAASSGQSDLRGLRADRHRR